MKIFNYSYHLKINLSQTPLVFLRVGLILIALLALTACGGGGGGGGGAPAPVDTATDDGSTDEGDGDGDGGGGGTLPPVPAAPTLSARSTTVLVTVDYHTGSIFDIYASTADFTSATDGTLINTVMESSLSIDLPLVDAADTVYYVRVTETDSGGVASPLSDVATITILATPVLSSLSAAGNSITVDWAADADGSYNIYYASSAINVYVPGTLVTGGPHASGPVSFDFTDTDVTNVYLAVTKSATNSESAHSTTSDADLNAYVQIQTTGPGLSITSDGTNNDIYVNSNNLAEVYVRTSAGVGETDGLVATTTAAYTMVSHTVPAFFDNSGNPITYYYAARTLWSASDSIGTSVSPMGAEANHTNSHADFLVRGANPTVIKLGTNDVFYVDDNSYVDLLRDGSTGTELYSYSGSIGDFVVESDDTTFYFGSNDEGSANSVYKVSGGSIISQVEVSVSNGVVKLAHDATYLYAATSSGGLLRITKADMVTIDLLDGGLVNITNIIPDGSRTTESTYIYYGDVSGIHRVDQAASVTTLTSAFDPGAMALSGATLYFTEAGTPATALRHSLSSLDTETSVVTKHLDYLNHPTNLRLFNGGVIWTELENVFAGSLNTSTSLWEPMKLATMSSLAGLAVQGSGDTVTIYVGTGNALYNFPASYLHNPPPAPGAPVLTVTPGDTAVTTGWDAVPGAAWYLVDASNTITTDFDLFNVEPSGEDAESLVIDSLDNGPTALTNGNNHDIKITGYNISGPGAVSSTASATPEIAQPTVSVSQSGVSGGVLGVGVSWTNPIPRDVTVKIYGSPTSPVAIDPGNLIQTAVNTDVSGTSVSEFYDHTNLTDGWAYYYTATIADAAATSIPAEETGTVPFDRTLYEELISTYQWDAINMVELNGKLYFVPRGSQKVHEYDPGASIVAGVNPIILTMSGGSWVSGRYLEVVGTKIYADDYNSSSLYEIVPSGLNSTTATIVGSFGGNYLNFILSDGFKIYGFTWVNSQTEIRAFDPANPGTTPIIHTADGRAFRGTASANELVYDLEGQHLYRLDLSNNTETALNMDVSWINDIAIAGANAYVTDRDSSDYSYWLVKIPLNGAAGSRLFELPTQVTGITVDGAGNIYGERDTTLNTAVFRELFKMAPDGTITPFAPGYLNATDMWFFPGSPDTLYISDGGRTRRVDKFTYPVSP